jgi:hypothetical protein
MYYAKLSNAFNVASGRDIDDKVSCQSRRIFRNKDPNGKLSDHLPLIQFKFLRLRQVLVERQVSQVTVKTAVPHELTAGTPIKISGVSPEDYNISTKVQGVSPSDTTVFTYLLPKF